MHRKRQPNRHKTYDRNETQHQTLGPKQTDGSARTLRFRF
jgi:hypothetical protein